MAYKSIIEFIFGESCEKNMIFLVVYGTWNLALIWKVTLVYKPL